MRDEDDSCLIADRIRDPIGLYVVGTRLYVYEEGGEVLKSFLESIAQLFSVFVAPIGGKCNNH
jgi:hypothetical protein